MTRSPRREKGLRDEKSAGIEREKNLLLIVDDHADTRRLLSTGWRTHHSHTVVAADARQAISVARKEQPDAALLDVGFPGVKGLT